MITSAVGSLLGALLHGWAANPWLTLIGVALGTVAGGRVLVRIPPAWFRSTVAVIIGLLGLLMLVRGVMEGA